MSSAAENGRSNTAVANEPPFTAAERCVHRRAAHSNAARTTKSAACALKPLAGSRRSWINLRHQSAAITRTVRTSTVRAPTHRLALRFGHLRQYGLTAGRLPGDAALQVERDRALGLQRRLCRLDRGQ